MPLPIYQKYMVALPAFWHFIFHQHHSRAFASFVFHLKTLWEISTSKLLEGLQSTLLIFLYLWIVQGPSNQTQTILWPSWSYEIIWGLLQKNTFPILNFLYFSFSKIRSFFNFNNKHVKIQNENGWSLILVAVFIVQ